MTAEHKLLRSVDKLCNCSAAHYRSESWAPYTMELLT